VVEVVGVEVGVVGMVISILLCDEVLPYFVLCVEVIRSSNLNLNQNGFNL
jgi:hypothetical protein